jgi:hypothetical protein
MDETPKPISLEQRRREERLAKALRDNLRRRKAAAPPAASERRTEDIADIEESPSAKAPGHEP